MWGDVEAAREASRQAFIDLCESGTLTQEIGRRDLRGVGTIIELNNRGVATTDRRTIRVSSPLTTEYERVLTFGTSERYDALVNCVIVPPNVQVKIQHGNIRGTETLFTFSSGHTAFSWLRSHGNLSRPALHARCSESHCNEDVASITDVEIRFLYLHRLSLTDADIENFWRATREAKINENGEILHRIRIDWLDWLDRVDRGHPVYDIETDDLSRQCERAAIIKAELDELEATDYRSWFDVCEQ